MMKIYMGVPGEPPIITVTDPQHSALLDGGPFGWGQTLVGTIAIPDNRGAALAKAILADYLGDPDQAAALARRFQHRMIVVLAAAKPWKITSTEIDRVLADMQAVADDPDVRRARLLVNQALAPVADERGIGFNGQALSPVEKKGGV